jgi:L-ascorbate metabolism protein UlaG (beta-lactamase superfamily)
MAGRRLRDPPRGWPQPYFAGDTSLFGDMRLIGEMSSRDRVPADRRSVHDGPRRRRPRACVLLGVRQIVPMHWGTFALLTGTGGRRR